MLKWKEGSLSQNGKIVVKAGEIIPEGLLEQSTIDRFKKSGAIEEIIEPKPVKPSKKGGKKSADEVDIKDLV